MENPDNLPDKIARSELLKVFGPAIIAALLFWPKGCFKCSDELALPLDTELPITEKIAPIQNQTKNKLSNILSMPDESPGAPAPAKSETKVRWEKTFVELVLETRIAEFTKLNLPGGCPEETEMKSQLTCNSNPLGNKNGTIGTK
ncbi:hypothetical protein HZA39_00080 [Candidatus Peregrinibacteria bacterium]|nr:hypothetical protein [Candidatus Peregrinibacteria bacterium]